ncbi:MAG: DUF1016 domain-containing protein [Firmicutes bacterium]|nr:DUF1016 domain-containing protein [Bacillota bacterium]
MDFYNKIKNRLVENENYAKIKDYSKEKYKVQTYYEVGRILRDAGKCYGENIIEKYALKLQVDVGKKFNRRILFRMRQFFLMFEDEKVSTLSTYLSWSHYVELLGIEDVGKIFYYVNLVRNQNLTVRELREKIKNKEYERLDKSTKLKIINYEELSIQETIKNPIIIKSKNIGDNLSEKDLKNIIMENIPLFLKELGNKFAFVDTEFKIKIGDKYNYIDLLLYNISYKCYVVIELKVTELKKEHIGQIETYMKFIDKEVKTFEENKTIGIIICKINNRFIMEYCSDSRLLTREYIIKK